MPNSASIVHAKVSTKPAVADSSIIGGPDWNAAHVLTGLDQVDNTSDVNKPVSTAQSTADALVASNAASALSTGLALKANIASPTLTGTPAAPTAVIGTNTTQLATTAFVLANGGGIPAAATPIVDGTGAVGTSLKYAREDHVHPSDTSRLAVASDLSDLPSNAWTAYTPTLAVTGGTLSGGATSGAYRRVGRLIICRMKVTWSGGSASGASALQVGLPVNCLAGSVGNGSGLNQGTNKMLNLALGLAAVGTASVFNYDATFPVTTNTDTLWMTGFYEAAT